MCFLTLVFRPTWFRIVITSILYADGNTIVEAFLKGLSADYRCLFLQLAIFALVLVFAAALAIEVANRNGMTLTGNAGYVHWRAMCKDFNTFCSVVECSFAACGLAFLALIAGTFLDGYFIHKNYSD